MVALIRSNAESPRKVTVARSAAGPFFGAEALARPERMTSLPRPAEVDEPEVGQDRPSPSPSPAPALRLVVDNSADARFGQDRLLSGKLPALDRRPVLVVLSAAIAVLGLLLAIRSVQGSPSIGSLEPANTVTEPVLAGESGPALGLDVVTVTAQPGDSLWTIARSLDPAADPRPAVAALIEANGSDSVGIGQQIVIPDELLD